MQTASIEQYLISICLLIIDEFNELYSALSKPDLKKLGDTKYNEMDITVRVGYPFKSLAHYTATDKDKQRKASKSNHDVVIDSKDFRIEIKFANNNLSRSGNTTNSDNWEKYQQDFNWITEEVATHKHKSAFIIGWFNGDRSLGSLLQLGKTRGSRSVTNEDRLAYFPFLYQCRKGGYTDELSYRYNQAYSSMPVTLVGNEAVLNCMFLGKESDVFHFALYY